MLLLGIAACVPNWRKPERWRLLALLAVSEQVYLCPTQSHGNCMFVLECTRDSVYTSIYRAGDIDVLSTQVFRLAYFCLIFGVPSTSLTRPFSAHPDEDPTSNSTSLVPSCNATFINGTYVNPSQANWIMNNTMLHCVPFCSRL